MIPKIISGRSWSSPGGQATTTSGPRPFPPARKARESSAEHVAGEVLLGHGDVSPFPAFTQLVQIGERHVAQHRCQGELGQQPVEHTFSGRLVEVVEGTPNA